MKITPLFFPNQRAAKLRAALIFFLSSFLTQVTHAQFTLGNLVVMKIGDGVSTLTSTGNPIIFNEYNTSGVLTYSVPVPSTGTNALVIRGNATSEGYISLSADGNYIVFGAYMQALPSASVLNTSSASNINRGIGIINSVGSFSIGASSAAASIASGDIRGATATGNSHFWGSSSSQGLSYYGSAAVPTNVENSKTNLRSTHIFNNQLYISSQVQTGTPPDIGILSVGSGTPNVAAQTVSTVINTGASSQPGQFYFNSSSSICYIADARNSALGGVQKWVYSAGSWSLAYTLPTGTASIGAFGVVANFSGLNPLVYATTTEGSTNRLVAISDIGANSTATTLATASANTIFRGLVFSPVSSTCVPVSISTVTNSSPVCSAKNLSLNVTVNGTSPYTYTWSGSGQFSSISVANPNVVNSLSGNYVVQVSNACGTASASTNVTANPTPTILVNAATICSGGIATITASGANSYSWSTGNANSSFTAGPLSNTNYTVIGTSLAGCVNTATTSITITNNPSLTVSSATICSGKSATITASGATAYSWSNGATTGLIVVSPSLTTSYTVMGSVSGCTAQLIGVANVIVNPTPSVSLTLPQSLVCLHDGSMVLSGLPAGGIYSGNGLNNSGIFNPTQAGIGTYSLSYKLTDANNCSGGDLKIITVSGCVGLAETQTRKISIYPQPVSEHLYIVGSHQNLYTLAEIIDVTGKKVKSKSLIGEELFLDVRFLNSGVYFLRLLGPEQFYITKFIKE